MSFTVDANFLLYASDESGDRYRKARRRLNSLAEGPEIVYLFWPVLMAYLRIATHPSVFASPLDPGQAMSNVAALVALPHVRCPGEGEGFWEIYESIAAGQPVRGNLVADAHLVALMKQHGIGVIWTEDRDFHRFRGIEVRSLDGDA